MNKKNMSSAWPKWKDQLDSPILQGGTRLNGVIKNNTPEEPLISYVTVVRNNAETIERTILSVIGQTYKNVEHVVVDGASTDGTLDIIQKHSDSIDYYVSEPDEGLYDALNKAVELCSGQLILVLNSDDWLSDFSAEYAASKCNFGQKQLILGAAHVKVGNGETILWEPKEVTANSIFSVANCNHNAIYASKNAYEASGRYDSSYSIAGDFKWIMSCFNAGASFEYTSKALVNYSLGGLSSDIYWHMEESKRIAKERFPFLLGNEVTYLHYVYYPWREGFHYEIRNFNPKLEIDNMVQRYSDRPEFMAALDMEHGYLLNNVEVVPQSEEKYKSIKSLLKRFPLIFRITKSLYYKIKG